MRSLFTMRSVVAFFAAVLSLSTANAATPEAAKISLLDDWKIEVSYKGIVEKLEVAPAEVEQVTAEKHEKLPIYDPHRSWNAECVPMNTRGPEWTPITNALDCDSVEIRAGNGSDSQLYEKNVDFQIMPLWGSIGRLPGGKIKENQPVWISYRYGKMRLDSVVLTASGKMEVRRGVPHIANPEPPKIQNKETRLGNIWVQARITKLEPKLIFPVLEHAYPQQAKAAPGESVAEKRLPKTMEKLKSGQKLRVLAWGDSVTDAGYLKDRSQRWQERFQKQLQARFPEAEVELITEAWGGRTTTAYLAEPPGSEKNYQEKVLESKPDLVVMEFVNDAGLPTAVLEEVYPRLLEDFRKNGIEWVILTPHYVRPDWMGLDREREIDEDPRPYVAFLRNFGEKNDIAIADAAARYGRLWRQGIPYSTLMTNAINHPNAHAMQIFTDALMEIFPE